MDFSMRMFAKKRVHVNVVYINFMYHLVFCFDSINFLILLHKRNLGRDQENLITKMHQLYLGK